MAANYFYLAVTSIQSDTCSHMFCQTAVHGAIGVMSLTEGSDSESAVPTLVCDPTTFLTQAQHSNVLSHTTGRKPHTMQVLFNVRDM